MERTKQERNDEAIDSRWLEEERDGERALARHVRVTRAYVYMYSCPGWRRVRR